MNKKILSGIIIGLAIVFMILNPALMGIIAVLFWLKLVIMRWKRKNIFNDKTDLEKKKKLSIILNASIIISGISFPVSLVAIFLHNVQSSQFQKEETFYFIIGIIALLVFIIATAGALFVFIKGRQRLQ